MSAKAEFFAWVDSVLLKPIPECTEGFHFNLYEGTDSVHVQLVGTEGFKPGQDPDTDYWPADETFSSGENIFQIPYAVAGAGWPEWLKTTTDLVRSYIDEGVQSTLMRSRKGVGLGFVDGDMHVVWQRDAA